jgi:preprotein translocase subunit SecF
VLLVLVAIFSLALRQLNWGLDFTGGTLVEVHYGETADLERIRDTLEGAGYGGAVVVSFGTDRTC